MQLCLASLRKKLDGSCHRSIQSCSYGLVQDLCAHFFFLSDLLSLVLGSLSIRSPQVVTKSFPRYIETSCLGRKDSIYFQSVPVKMPGGRRWACLNHRPTLSPGWSQPHLIQEEVFPPIDTGWPKGQVSSTGESMVTLDGLKRPSISRLV